MKCRDCQEEITLYEDGQYHVADFYTPGTEMYERVAAIEQGKKMWYNGFACPMDNVGTSGRHTPEPALVPYLRQVLSEGEQPSVAYLRGGAK